MSKADATQLLYSYLVLVLSSYTAPALHSSSLAVDCRPFGWSCSDAPQLQLLTSPCGALRCFVPRLGGLGNEGPIKEAVPRQFVQLYKSRSALQLGEGKSP